MVQNLRKAIKQFSIDKYKPREISEQIFPEIRELVRLSHDHKIRYYNRFCDKQFLYLVMEYCEDGNLRSYLTKNKNINCKQVFTWCKQIVSVLRFLQKNKRIHKDLKSK